MKYYLDPQACVRHALSLTVPICHHNLMWKIILFLVIKTTTYIYIGQGNIRMILVFNGVIGPTNTTDVPGNNNA